MKNPTNFSGISVSIEKLLDLPHIAGHSFVPKLMLGTCEHNVVRMSCTICFPAATKISESGDTLFRTYDANDQVRYVNIDGVETAALEGVAKVMDIFYSRLDAARIDSLDDSKGVNEL